MAVLAQYLFGTVNVAETGAGYGPDTTASGLTNSNVTDGGANISISIATTGTYPTNPVCLVVTAGVASTTVAQAVTNGCYVQVVVTPSSGKMMSLTTLTFDIARGGAAAPRGYALRSSIDAFATDIATADIPTVRSIFTSVSVDLSGASFQNVTTAITFRLYFYTPSLGQSIEFDSLTLNGTVADTAITGSGSGTLGALTGSGTGTVAIQGSGSATLAPLTGSGTGAVAIQGSGSGTLGALTGSGAAQAVIQGTGNRTLGALTGSGSGTVAIRGSASIVLGALTGSGAGGSNGGTTLNDTLVESAYDARLVGGVAIAPLTAGKFAIAGGSRRRVVIVDAAAGGPPLVVGESADLGVYPMALISSGTYLYALAENTLVKLTLDDTPVVMATYRIDCDWPYWIGHHNDRLVCANGTGGVQVLSVSGILISQCDWHGAGAGAIRAAVAADGRIYAYDRHGRGVLYAILEDIVYPMQTLDLPNSARVIKSISIYDENLVLCDDTTVYQFDITDGEPELLRLKRFPGNVLAAVAATPAGYWVGGRDIITELEWNRVWNTAAAYQAGFGVASVDGFRGVAHLQLLPLVYDYDTGLPVEYQSLEAPSITSLLAVSGTLGSPFSYTITATGATSFSTDGSLPTGLSLNSATGVISGTVANGGVGLIANVWIRALNAAGTDTRRLVITLAVPAPVINSSLTANGNQGSAFSYTITATNSPTSFNATGLPAGLAINTSTGVISGTPTSSGVSSVTISATNAGGTDTETLTLTIAVPSYDLLAVGNNGLLRGSNDHGVTWTAIPAFTVNNIESVCWDGTRYVALVGSTEIWTSPNGSAWTLFGTRSSSLYGIRYGNGYYVAISTGPGTPHTSTDLVTWTPRTASGSLAIALPHYSNGRWITFTGVSGQGAFRSTNSTPLAWTQGTNYLYGGSSGLGGFAYNGTTLVAAHDHELNDQTIYRSSNLGDSWTLATGVEGAGGGSIRCIAWGGGLFVALGGSTGAKTSPDGTTWTNRTVALGFLPANVVYSGARFVAFAGAGKIATSADGITWALPSTGTTTAFTDIASRN